MFVRRNIPDPSGYLTLHPSQSHLSTSNTQCQKTELKQLSRTPELEEPELEAGTEALAAEEVTRPTEALAAAALAAAFPEATDLSRILGNTRRMD